MNRIESSGGLIMRITMRNISNLPPRSSRTHILTPWYPTRNTTSNLSVCLHLSKYGQSYQSKICHTFCGPGQMAGFYVTECERNVNRDSSTREVNFFCKTALWSVSRTPLLCGIVVTNHFCAQRTLLWSRRYGQHSVVTVIVLVAVVRVILCVRRGLRGLSFVLAFSCLHCLTSSAASQAS
jgi:hypothetical protein